jgi:hypothetical protein
LTILAVMNRLSYTGMTTRRVTASQEETDGGYMVSPRQAIAFRGKNVTLI